eukprot:2901183-Prymnesium_polylepis.1
MKRNEMATRNTRVLANAPSTQCDPVRGARARGVHIQTGDDDVSRYNVQAMLFALVNRHVRAALSADLVLRATTMLSRGPVA